MPAAQPPGSNVYTHGHHDSVLRSHGTRTAENSAAYLLPHLRPGMTLLDVGAGPGTITAGLARAVAPGAVVGIETTTEIVATAAAGAGAGIDTLAFEVADVYDLPYDDDAFDVVHAHQVLQHLDDPVAALRSMRRVTKAGGLVAVRDADYAGMFWYPDVAGLERWREIYQAVARSNDGEPNAGRRLPAWAHAAGFDDITVSAGTWCYTTADDRAWWSQTWADRIRYSRMAEHALVRGLATAAELDELGDAWLTWGADADGTFVIPHLEVLAVA
jgi:ubiquinone/menaquinone biosynthesis C-methylase UbiE